MAKILMAYADWQHNPDRKRLNTYGGVGYYRIVKVAQQLKGHEVTVVGQELVHYGKTIEEQWDNIFKEFDVFWTNYFADPAIGSAIIYHAQKHKKKFILDIDDNYLDIPESNLIYDEFKKTKHKRAFLSTIISFADAVTVSTEPLKNRIQSHIKELHGIDKPVFVIPNMNDINDWNYPKAELPTDRITIGYSGSNSHQDDIRMVMPAIAKIMNENKKVHLEFVGAIGKNKVQETLRGFGLTDNALDRIGLLPATATFKEYPQYLSQQKWHIGICPLVDTAFTRSKSHIKWMEYSMYKIPTIASRVYPYFMELCGRQTIDDGETGYLCKPHEWYDTLQDVISNYDKRKIVGENAFNFIKDEWQYDSTMINKVVNKMLE